MLHEYDFHSCATARPFISDDAWAIFSCVVTLHWRRSMKNDSQCHHILVWDDLVATRYRLLYRYILYQYPCCFPSSLHILYSSTFSVAMWLCFFVILDCFIFLLIRYELMPRGHKYRLLSTVALLPNPTCNPYCYSLLIGYSMSHGTYLPNRIIKTK